MIGVPPCPATTTLRSMAGLELDCRLRDGHTLPHIDTATGARWIDDDEDEDEL